MINRDLISLTLQHSIKLLALQVQVFHLLVKELLYFLFYMCWTCAITFYSTSSHCWPASLTATHTNNCIITVSKCY